MCLSQINKNYCQRNKAFAFAILNIIIKCVLNLQRNQQKLVCNKYWKLEELKEVMQKHMDYHFKQFITDT